MQVVYKLKYIYMHLHWCDPPSPHACIYLHFDASPSTPTPSLSGKVITECHPHQTWSIDRYKQEQYFFEIFWTIWKSRAKFQALLNLATCSNYSRSNFPSSFQCFIYYKGESVNKGIKNGEYRLLKIDRSHYIVIALKS